MNSMLSNYGWWQLAWEIIISIILAGTALYTWLSSKNKVNAQEISDLRGVVSTQAERLASLEASCLRGTELQRVHERVDNLTQEVSRVSGGMAAMNESLMLIHQYLLDSKK